MGGVSGVELDGGGVSGLELVVGGVSGLELVAGGVESSEEVVSDGALSDEIVFSELDSEFIAIAQPVAIEREPTTNKEVQSRANFFKIFIIIFSKCFFIPRGGT